MNHCKQHHIDCKYCCFYCITEEREKAGLPITLLENKCEICNGKSWTQDDNNKPPVVCAACGGVGGAA